MFSAEQIKILKEKMFVNLEIFARVACSHIFKQKTPWFHKDMYRQLQDNIDRLCFVVFRGGAKSTIGVTLNVLWRIVTDREKYIWIIAEGTRQASERLHDITYELKNNVIIKELYGEFIFEKDSEREIIIVNPATGHRLKIAALGSRQRMRGGLFEGNRLTLVILDDFESEANTETAELRDKLVRWLYATMRPVFDPKDGRILMLGTIVHPDAYLQSIRDNPGDWKVVEYPIELDGSKDGTKPTWPERFSAKFIQRERKDYSARGRLSLFYQEYYNEPVADEEKPFKEKLLKYYSGTFDRQYGAVTLDNGEKKTVNVVIGVDVAMGKRKGDFSAMSAVGQTEDKKIYLFSTQKICFSWYFI